jgi:hypothetical protein
VIADVLNRSEAVQQLGQLGLALMRQQEVEKCLEAAALVGICDRISASKDLIEELTLRARPSGNSLPKPPVESAEVLLDLSEVRQQLAGVSSELVVAVPLTRGVEQRYLAALGTGNLRIQLGASPA